MTITYRRIESTDPRLARHVRHDDRSRAYAFDTAGLSIVSAKHTRRIPVLDQGQLGSCTGNAGIGALGTDPYYATVVNVGANTGYGEEWRVRRPHLDPTQGTNTYFSLDEGGAVALYSAATKADDYPGTYPPDDTGSDGLTIAKVLTAAGEISGYQHTFNLDDALKALGVTPYITGVNWYSNMYGTDPDGRVFPTGSVEGGHEFVADEIDATNEQVWFTNSWGNNWGVVRDGWPGRFYLTFADFGTLLSQQGDVTIFTPLTQPAPTPTPPTPVPPAPPVDADHQLLADLARWLGEHHIGDNAHAKSAVLRWKARKGL